MEGILQDRRTLRGIAALLLALALLAERAAGRSFPVRFFALSILCRAETIARAFVADATGIDCPDEPPATRGLPVDAELLALRLRMLAAVLGALADAAADTHNCFAGSSAGLPLCPCGTPSPPALLVVRLPAARRRGPHDTS